MNYNPGSTQTKVQEMIITSNEGKIRLENVPTINDRVEMRKADLRQKAKEQLKKQKLAEQLRKMEEKRLKDEEEARKRAAKRRFFEREMNIPGIDVGPAEEDTNDSDGEDNEQDEEYKLAILLSKERRLVTQRLTAKFHNRMNPIRVLAVQAQLSLKIGSTSATYSEILPWLFIGRGKVAENIHALTKIGCTHVMNVTKEVGFSLKAQCLFLRNFLILKNCLDSEFFPDKFCLPKNSAIR